MATSLMIPFFQSDSLKDSIPGDIQGPLVGESVLDSGHGMVGFDPGITQIPGWYFIVLFALITAMAVAGVYFKNLFGSTFVSAFRFNLTVNRYYDNSQVQRQIDNILYANYFLSFGFFLFYIEKFYSLHPYGLTGFRLFLFNVSLLILLFVFRIVLLNLTGQLFNRLKLFREYIYHTFTYNKLLGLLILPGNFFIIYIDSQLRESVIAIALLIVVLIQAMKIIRGVIFSQKRRVFSFYLFLYLCALEMVPILLIYKWATTTL